MHNDKAQIEKQCPAFPKLGRTLGRGASGTVYETNVKNRVAKVMKTNKLNKSEVSISKAMYKLNLTPKIHNIKTCKKADLTMIVMNYAGIGLSEWVKGKSLKQRMAAREEILKLVNKFHKAGYYHGDLHKNQIMIKGNKWYIIDWGLSSRHSGGRRFLPWWLGIKTTAGKRNQHANAVVSKALKVQPEKYATSLRNILNIK